MSWFNSSKLHLSVWMEPLRVVTWPLSGRLHGFFPYVPPRLLFPYTVALLSFLRITLAVSSNQSSTNNIFQLPIQLIWTIRRTWEIITIILFPVPYSPPLCVACMNSLYAWMLSCQVTLNAVVKYEMVSSSPYYSIRHPFHPNLPAFHYKFRSQPFTVHYAHLLPSSQTRVSLTKLSYYLLCIPCKAFTFGYC